jgi:plastocyanin
MNHLPTERGRNMRRAFKLALIGVCFWVAIFLMFLLVTTAHGKPAARPPAAPAADVQVKVDNFSFMPADLKVPVGTKVTWVNRDDVPHTVVSNDGKFSSPALETDEQFSFTFNAAGTYEYYCSVHPKMTAKVIVQ